MDIPVMVDDRVKQLYNLGIECGVDVLGEMIEIFRKTGPVRVEAMRGALAVEDWKTLEREAHTLKSSSGNLGFLRLQNHCLEIGKAIPEHNSSQLRQMITKADTEIQFAMKELSSVLSRLSYKQAA